MNIVVIGTGYVGLVSAACFAEIGHHVTCVDNDKSKIDRLLRGYVPFYEPGLEQMVAANVAARRLAFSTELEEFLDAAQAVFIAVGTPTRAGDGHADLSFVFAVTDALASRVRHPVVVVCKSTVPVGTNREIARRLQRTVQIEVASNPEFLREGMAIEDFVRPDRIVIGAETDFARNTLLEIYSPLGLAPEAIVISGLELAELIKYASNAFLATRLSFINEIADSLRTGRSRRKGRGVRHGLGSQDRHAIPRCRAGVRRVVLPERYPSPAGVGAASRRCSAHRRCCCQRQ